MFPKRHGTLLHHSGRWTLIPSLCGVADRRVVSVYLSTLFYPLTFFPASLTCLLPKGREKQKSKSFFSFTLCLTVCLSVYLSVFLSCLVLYGFFVCLSVNCLPVNLKTKTYKRIFKNKNMRKIRANGRMIV